MRVVSGLARGCVLAAPDGFHTRPTADRIKESLFNIIHAELPDAVFLDLFAGTGAIGIEALSRGAKKVVFVDNSNESINAVNENLEKTGLAENAAILRMDALRAADWLGQKGGEFDIIYMDPPYKKGFVDKTLRAIVNAKILKDDGFIIAEQGFGEPLPHIAGLTVYREKKYGRTSIVFLRRSDNESGLSGQL